jgi:threonine/homoserine/homoserine lactone efflux protein
MVIFWKLFSIFTLGLLGGVIPGPVLTASFTETLRGGFRNGLRILLMSMVAESIIATFILLVFSSAQIPRDFFYLISFIGSFILVWTAIKIWKIDKVEEGSRIFTFKEIFLMLVSGGPFWIFWITVCVPQAVLLNEEVGGGYVLFLIVFESGWLASAALLNFIFSRFRPLLRKKNLISAVFKVCSLVLVFFAIKLVIESVLFFFH